MEQLYYHDDSVTSLWATCLVVGDAQLHGDGARLPSNPSEIHPKILKYLSVNESFINAMCRLFEKCKEYEIVPNIWKTVIVIPLHKKV